MAAAGRFHATIKGGYWVECAAVGALNGAVDRILLCQRALWRAIFAVAGVCTCHAGHRCFLDTNGQISVYFEAAAVIVTLVLLGQVMKLRACEGTGKVIRR